MEIGAWERTKKAGNQLQKVEEEDEFVVENVHNGLRSSFYKAGRFSPTREEGVHHFHKLISKFMNQWLEKPNPLNNSLNQNNKYGILLKDSVI